MEIAWTDSALGDMADLDKGVAERVRQAVERFAGTGAGNVRRLQGIDPPEFRLRVGDYRVRFYSDSKTSRSYASAIAAKLTDEPHPGKKV